MNYCELFINDPATAKLDLNQEFSIALQYSIADIKDITKRNAAFSKTIQIPGTKNNNFWMGNLYDVNADFTAFNPNVKTPCSISVNSEVVMRGFLQLRKIKKLINVDQQGNLIYYEVVVFNNAVDLMTELGERTMSQLSLDELEHTYTRSNITFSWTQSWTNGWVYPMYGLKDSNNQYEVTDFYPAYYSRYLIDTIFSEAGFGWTGSLKTNPQFLQEILPFVGAGSQSVSQESIDEQSFRVGITQSSSFSRLLGPGANAPSGSGVIIASNPTAQYEFSPGWTYSFPSDNYVDNLSPQNNFFDNGNTFNTTTSIWTTNVNRKWKPRFVLNYDLQFTNPHPTDAARVIPGPGVGLGAPPPNTVDNMKLYITHVIEYKLPATSAWLFWDSKMVAKHGWTASNSLGYMPGVTHSESIYLDYTCQERVIPAGTQVRLRTFIQPCTGGNAAPFNINYNPYACYKSLGNYGISSVSYDTSQPRQMRMTVRYKTSPQNFLFNNGQSYAAQEGDDIKAKEWLSSKLKQKEFISDLIKRYNLFIQVDPSNERQLILDTRPDFYNKVLNLDWTNKKDFSSEDEITLLAELQFKEMLFTMKADTSDPHTKDYQDLTGDVYGQYKYTFGNEFVKGQSKIESPFSPTPLLKTAFGAITPALSPEDPKVSPRVLYWGGLKTPPTGNFTWTLTSINGSPTTYTAYPYAGHFDDPFYPTLDIHFGTPKYMYYTDYGTLPSDTMYETYWADYVNQIEDGKLVKSRFYLDEFDIRTIKDNFWAKIFVVDSYYYVNKIIDYKPMESGLTTVELLKIKEGFKYIKKPGRTASLARPIGLVKSPFINGNLGLKNSVDILGSLVVGNNNKVSGSVQLGDTSTAARQLVLGDNNIVNGDKGVVIGGDNNLLNGGSNLVLQSSNVITDGDNLLVIARTDATFSDTSSAYIGTGIKGDLSGKPGRYPQYSKGVNLAVEGYDLGQSDWRYIPQAKEIVIQSGKEARPSELTILGSLEIEDITSTFSFGNSTIYQQGFLEVETQLNVDGLLTVGGELCVGKCGESGGSGGAGSSGTSGTSGGGSGSGTSGTSGVSGTSGTSGAIGATGANGSSGTSGNNGSSGTSGAAGANGTSGTSGAIGATGANGSSGTSGTSPSQTLQQTLSLGNTAGTYSILLTSGTTASPGLAFSSDTDTGFILRGGNNFGAIAGTLPVVAFVNAASTPVMAMIDTATGKFYSGDGTALLPGITWENDTNTGIFRPTADTIGLASNGATISLVSNAVQQYFTHGGTMRFQFGSAAFEISSTPFRVIDGTVGTPSISFTNDTDTGLYRVGANSVGIAVGGAGNLIVDSSRVTVPTGSMASPSLVFSGENTTGFSRPGPSTIGVSIGGATASQFDGSTTAGNTRLLLWDVSAGTLKRVSIGATDSGGTGFKVLRIPN